MTWTGWFVYLILAFSINFALTNTLLEGTSIWVQLILLTLLDAGICFGLGTIFDEDEDEDEDYY